MKKTDKEVTGVGIIASAIAYLYCIGSLILIALGLGTASTVLSIGAKSPYFLAIGLIFFAVSLFLIINHKGIIFPGENEILSWSGKDHLPV